MMMYKAKTIPECWSQIVVTLVNFTSEAKEEAET